MTADGKWDLWPKDRTENQRHAKQERIEREEHPTGEAIQKYGGAILVSQIKDGLSP